MKVKRIKVLGGEYIHYINVFGQIVYSIYLPDKPLTVDHSNSSI